MGQCAKVEKGKRCAETALKGSNFCKRHKPSGSSGRARKMARKKK